MKPEAKAIKPQQRGRADFFSWQLYRWIKQRPHAYQIWRGTWNSVTGIDSAPAHPMLYIGHMDNDGNGSRWLHGRLLKNLCLHRQKIEGFAYGPAHDTGNWVEITDEWWAEYMRIGVCAIHGDYAHAWHEDGDTRTCLHCGKREVRTIKVVELNVWVSETASH